MNRIDRLYAYLTSNVLLFFSCAGIWGSTWLVIKYQLDDTDPVASVFYRFLISTLVLFTFAKLSNRSLSYPKKFHYIFFLQGACNFSINYIITYWAEQYATSATIAIAFTLLVPYNIMGMKFFFKRKISPRVYLGAICGVIGILFIFGHELTTLNTASAKLKGLSLGLLATFFASAGNMFSYKNHLNKIPVTIANAWGMFYGTIVTLVIALILQKPLHISITPSYWLSLLYLSVFGTVLAFGAYLTLVGRIGAERAGYTSILSPVIALSLSILFEGFKLTPLISIGLLCCLVGTLITLFANKTASNILPNSK